MDRRESLKSMLITSIAGGIGLQACNPETSTTDSPAEAPSMGLYGRTPEEITRDEKLMSEEFLTDSELKTIAELCDIILPDFEGTPGAVEAGVADFIDFIVKDITRHQVPLRGGIMWLNAVCNKEFGKPFIACSREQQITIVDRIAYPEKAAATDRQGVAFFSMMRDLTLTGYYTSQAGIADLGYKGNTPNVWDGVPDDVLKEHGMEYPKEWLPSFVDQSKRNIKAEWDDEGNLIT